MSSLNVPTAPAQLTSEESMRLEKLLMQEIQAREAVTSELAEERQAREVLSRQVAELQRQLGGSKGVPTRPEDRPAEQTIIPKEAPEMLKAFDQPPPPGEKQGSDPRDDAAVTPSRLDAGGMYQAEQSVWDACVLVGHPCLGTGVSASMALLWVANLAAQIYFCVVVVKYMSTPDIGDDELNELLRYRVGIAHNIAFADPVAERSMIAELCDQDTRLHMSSAQADWYSTIIRFLDGGGPNLMILAQFLWICTVFREMIAAWSLGHSLAYVSRGSKTRVILAESDSDSVDDESEVKTTFSGSPESLLTLMVVVRIASISRKRFWASIVLVVVPRMAMALTILYTGIMYLGKTHVPDDLILNAIALEFICGIDELLFSVFAPRRMQTLMANIEAFPLPQRVFPRLAGLLSLFKLVLVFIAIIIVQLVVLNPFFWHLEQASDILCKGEVNFVWARNPSTGMVHVAKSDDTLIDMTKQEQYLLQVAQPPILAKYGWDPGSDVLFYSAATDYTRAVLEWSTTVSDISQIEYSTEYFQKVKDLSAYSTAEAAANLQCVDMSAGQSVAASVEYLQAIVGDPTIQKCSDVPWQYCSRQSMTALRSICPVTCGCDKPGRFYNTAYAGFFQSTTFGCPSQCDVETAIRNEIVYSTSNLEESLTGGAYACEDLPYEDFVFTDTCVDTDQFTLARNEQNMACSAPSICTGKDDADFTAADMCCNCPGGGESNVTTSTDCIGDSLADKCRNMNPAAFWYILYVRGLFEHLSSLTDFASHVASVVNKATSSLDIVPDMNDVTELTRWISNGSMRQSFVDGSWSLMPGVEHPRGLKGCEYLASFEIKSILGLDLCKSEFYSSIAFLCPVSCGCTTSAYSSSASGHPPSITYTPTTEITIFSNARTALTKCPAACVLAHPIISGSNAYDNYDASSAKGR